MVPSRILKAITWYFRLYIKKETPVIVFAPGRVGSMALHKNLLDAGVFAFKVEFYENEPRGAARFVKRHIFDKRKEAKIITLVRDPPHMMSSYFFSKASKGHLADAQTALQHGDLERLHTYFIKDVLETKRLDQHLYWFENDFVNATKINIFKYPFNTEKGFGTISDKTFPVLLLRTELDNNIKCAQIKEFLQISELTITKENTRDSKQNYTIYSLFKDSLKLPEKLTKKIYSSPVAQHFLTPEETATAFARYAE